MLRKTPEHGFGSGSPKPGVSAASLLITLSAFMTLCAKKAGRVSRKLKTKTKSFSRNNRTGIIDFDGVSHSTKGAHNDVKQQSDHVHA
uniref:Uncharacterized protein n=1 Tax=Fagus sylvatica TaxID=28930 RepID=A0A2N9HK48_FAGSY